MRIVKKTLKGDLMGRTGFKSVPARAKTAVPEAPKAPDPVQRVLDAVADDDLTVITEPVPIRHGKAIVLNADHKEVAPAGTRSPPSGSDPDLAGAPPIKAKARKDAPAATPAPQDATAPPAPASKALVIDGGAVPLARSVLAEALFRDFGAPGTKIQQPKGSNFEIHPRTATGVVRTQHNLMLPLPEGHGTSHAADIVVELENGALLVLDIVPSTVTTHEMKALSYDALQLRRLDLAFSVLVFVRLPGNGMAQDQATAIGHGYDFHFGLPEDAVHSEQAFAALRSRIQVWLKAASAK